jgi:L-serine deaminase
VAHHTLVGLSASTAYAISRVNSGSNATFTVTATTGGTVTSTANGTLGVTL